jgi:transcriptional regulator with XRE-family HTH domain
MDDLGKRTQAWKDSNPLIVWRKAQGLTGQQVAERFGMTDRRRLELEVGFAPLDVEWKEITPRTGITREQWAAWERGKPHIGVEPP